MKPVLRFSFLIRRCLPFLLAAVLPLTLLSCGHRNEGELSELGGLTSGEAAVDVLTAIELPSQAKVGSEDLSADTVVSLSGDDGEIRGEGAVLEDGTLTLTKAGSYLLQGSLEGQIVISLPEKDTVTLYLNGLSVTATEASALLVTCGNVEVYTAADSVNLLVAAVSEETAALAESSTAEEETALVKAALFSKDDLTFCGNGSLYVKATAVRGIFGKDDIVIRSGTLSVISDGNGVQGKESVTVKGGLLTVEAGGDGIHAGSSDDASIGEVAVAGGTLQISADEDGIQGGVSLTVYGGTITVQSGGGSEQNTSQGGDNFGDFGGGGGMNPGGDRFGGGMNPGGGGGNRPGTRQMAVTGTDTLPLAAETAEDISRKGLKADGKLTVKGGSLTVDSYDDALHATNITLNEGTILLSAGDDGVHTDENLEISGGTLTVSRSYEGLEGRYITIAGGVLSVTASDDGVNAADGSTSTTATGGMGGFGGIMGGMGGVSSDCWLSITGGTILINAAGDGLDSNGNIDQSGGVAVVFGPTNSGNGALDVGDSGNRYEISGGTLLAVGADGMAESAEGNGMAVLAGRTGTVSAGTLLALQDENGTTLLVFRTPKAFSHLVFSSEAVTEGESYTLLSGGSVEGDSGDSGLLDGVYSGGSKVQTFRAQ